MNIQPFLTFKTLYDDAGCLLYEGFTYNGKPFGEGKVYWPNGNIYMAGKFGLNGLVIGTEYYPDGKPRFIGNYSVTSLWDINPPAGGTLYNKTGKQIYSGVFITDNSYPKEPLITWPKNVRSVLQKGRPEFPVFSVADEDMLEKAVIQQLYADELKAAVKCPYCGKIDAVKIPYDVPDIDDEFKALIGYEPVRFGWDGQGAYDPGFRCNSCDREFGEWGFTCDDIVSWSFAEALEEVCFSREQARSFDNTYTISIKRTDNGAHVTSSGRTKHLILGDDYDISPKRWNKLASTLYDKLFLHNWQHSYKPEGYVVLDGESWSLEVKLLDSRETYTGDNAYPPYWNELLKLLRSYTRGKRIDEISEK